MNGTEHVNTVSGSVHAMVLQAHAVTADTIGSRHLRAWVDRADELARLLATV